MFRRIEVTPDESSSLLLFGDDMLDRAALFSGLKPESIGHVFFDAVENTCFSYINTDKSNDYILSTIMSDVFYAGLKQYGDIIEKLGCVPCAVQLSRFEAVPHRHAYFDIYNIPRNTFSLVGYRMNPWMVAVADDNGLLEFWEIEYPEPLTRDEPYQFIDLSSDVKLLGSERISKGDVFLIDTSVWHRFTPDVLCAGKLTGIKCDEKRIADYS